MKDRYPENYNQKTIIEIWGDFIDYKKRKTGEAGFLKKTLNHSNCHKVFDSCLGNGVDSIHLIREGFDVTSNDIDALMIKKAKENANKAKVTLKITEYDWLHLDKHFDEDSFDATICLGNSITYLFTKNNQLTTLRNFLHLLRKGGVLILDERNYQYMLDNREEILKGNFRYTRRYVYCGKKVHGKPVEITDNRVRMEYTHDEKEEKAYLILYPFKKGELVSLCKEAGFSKVEQYSDYKKGYNPDADFHQYVCVK